MTFSAYKVAVKLSLVSNVATGLAALSMQTRKFNGDVVGLQGSLTKIERQLLSIKKLGLIGGAMTVAGGAGLALFKAPIQAAMEYERAYTRFKTLNLGAEVNKQADSFARGTQAFGVSSTQLMDTFRETYGFFGDMPMAQAASKKIAELNAANSNLFKGKIGAIDEGSARSLMRFADMRGATNSLPDFFKTLNLAQRMVTGSGGAMQFRDLEQFAKRGGTAFKAMSDDGLMLMSTVIQEMGGSSAGTGLMSAYQNLVAGRTTKKAMAALQDLGLAKLGYVKHGDIGGKEYKTLQITKMKDDKTLRENFGLWVMNNVIPALEKRGIKDVGKQAAVVNDLLSNRTGSSLGVNFATQFLQALRDKNVTERAMGVDGTINENKNSATGKFGELTARWRDLMIEVGVMVLPKVIWATEGLLKVLKTVRDFAHEWPNLTRHLVIGFGALSGLVAAGGILALTAASIKGIGLALTLVQVGTLASGLAATAIGLKAVGGAAAAFMAAYVGWEVGGWLNKNVINPGVQELTGDKDATLGTMIYDWMHPNENQLFGLAPRVSPNNEQSGFIRPASKRNEVIDVKIKLTSSQEREFANIVAKVASRQSAFPLTGTSQPDFSMTLMPIGGN